MSHPNYIAHDPARRVPFASLSQYTRDEYSWWMRNTGQPSKLYLNGVFQEEESGNWDLKLDEVLAIQPNANGIKVGVIDTGYEHGLGVTELVCVTAPGVDVQLYPVARWYPDVVAPKIIAAANAGCKIIVIPSGWNVTSSALYSALFQLKKTGVVVVCSVPNNPQDIDVVMDYPASWTQLRDYVLPVAACDRAGKHYWSATGSNVITAPGRNIMFQSVYSSGSSYAAPIAAGCLSLLMASRPMMAATFCLQRLRDNADPGTPKRLNILNAINP